MATDLSNAYLWRANGLPQSVTAVRLSEVPRPGLHSGRHRRPPGAPMERRGLPGPAQSDGNQFRRAHFAMKRRKFATSGLRQSRPDAGLLRSFCPPPAEAAAWRKSLEAARVNDAVYAKALAAILTTFVCSGEDHAGFVFTMGGRADMNVFGLGSATYVLRGLLSPIPGFPSRLVAAGPEAPALIDFIMSKDCPVSAALTDDDRANLRALGRRSREREARG